MLGAATGIPESKLELSVEIQALFDRAKAGDAPAQYNLGVRCASGQGVERDAKQAVSWYRQAATQGLAEAQYALSVCYATGQGVEQDIKQAVIWCQKAAVQGHAEAQYNLGACYTTGQGVEQDIKQAVAWYQKAAAQGLAQAQYNLGACYTTGQGVEKDTQQAVAWYQKAAVQELVQAQYNLGVCYTTGQGVAQDAKQAVDWFQKAAAQGLAEAQYNLGTRYARGQGVEQDTKQAVAWYQKAAAQGDAWAQCNLGACYVNGRGVDKDEKQAVDWYRQSATRGHAGGQYKLGFCYATGQGVEKDAKQAADWFHQAAKQGSSRAAYLLGLCYASDWGIEKEEKNKERAVQWFQKAAELGLKGNTAEGLTSTGMFSQQPSHQDLQWKAYLGAGNFGVVFQGLRQSVPVAIKQLKMEHFIDMKILKAFKADCEMLLRLPRLPNVVQYLHCALTYPGGLVMEYALNGSLHDRLHGKRSHHSKPLLSWDNRYRLMTDIVRGLAHLHNAGILHGDLRSANVLLSGVEEKDNKNSEAKEVADEKLVAKVSDFGLAKTKEQVSRQASSKSGGSGWRLDSNDNTGVPGWLAPELYQPDGIKFTQKTDIYSLGTTLWEVVTGKEPIGNTTSQMGAPEKWHQREEIPKDCPPKIASLIRFCWKTEPAERPQAVEALKYLEESKEEDFEKFAASLKPKPS